MTDDRFEEALIDAARDYNEPPETPRDVMWARIEAVREERARRRKRLRVLHSPWTRWVVAVAAALAIGIGIGRLTIQEDVMESDVGATALEESDRRDRSQLAYRLVATNHMSRAETFLTSFRTNPDAEGADDEFWEGASELLTETRLLLDSPAAEDPVFRRLLEDLELVLVQINQLSGDGGSTEMEIVTEELESGGLLPRLRTMVPAGQGQRLIRG
ncbi:MAG: hypothetical protein GWN32_00855 [Gemmatimonadetes bacterium]|nr:hypothetical protein [Gemmatimonadota bacterium]